MNLNNFSNSKTIKTAAIIVGVIIFSLAVFKLGMIAGFKKADFSHSLGENYRNIFTNQTPSLGEKINDRNFMNANGAAGKIIKINEPFLFIEEPNNAEKIISTNETTMIRMFRDQIPFSQLKTDQFVVIIGEPTVGGQIGAKLIRVMPPVPAPLNPSMMNR